MTNAEIIGISTILSGIKINKIADKEAKSALLKGYLVIRRLAKSAEDERGEIVRKFQEDWRDELDSVQSFRQKGQEVVGHGEYLEAERDALDAIDVVLAREVGDLGMERIPAGCLMDAELWADDITLGQIPGTIEYLTEKGIVG